MPKMLRQGVVLIPENMDEAEDMRNAAQSALIGYTQERFIAGFKRPQLLPGGEFFANFSVAYNAYSQMHDFAIWEELCEKMDTIFCDGIDRPLSQVEAAYLTYVFLGYENIPPLSHELYLNLASFARAYESMLRKKYGDTYCNEQLYQSLREQMPLFLMQLIGMDSVISTLATMNAKPREQVDEQLILSAHTVIDSRFMHIGEDDSFRFRATFLDLISEHAQKNDIREDGVGRTEDRGCPFMYSTILHPLLHFAIEELIAQHQHYMHAYEPPI